MNKFCLFVLLFLSLSFATNFLPHQTATAVSEPYFEYKYVRSGVPTRCLVDVEPIENGTISFVQGTVTLWNGTLIDSVDFTQNENNTLQWHSDWFTVDITSLQNANNKGLNERGWINCSTVVKDSDYEIQTVTTQQYVGYTLPDCSTSDSCTLVNGQNDSRGYYYYDYIGLPSGEEIKIITSATETYHSYVYYYADTIEFNGTVRNTAFSDDGDFVTISADDIYVTDITLYANNGTTGTNTHPNGWEGGNIVLRDFIWATVDGKLNVNGGNGRDGWGPGVDSGTGGDGGECGTISFVGTAQKNGMLNLSSIISMYGGDGGDGYSSVSIDGEDGGDGGSDDTNRLSFSYVEVLLDYGARFSLYAGDGGNGGTCGDDDFGGAGGIGGDVRLAVIKSQFDDASNLNSFIYAGDGGNGGDSAVGVGTDGRGGDGGDAGFIYFDSDEISSLEMIPAITFTGGDGGDGGDASSNAGTNGDGGDASCMSHTANCAQTIMVYGIMDVTNSMTIVPGTGGSKGATGGGGGADGSTPASSPAWQISYNSSLVSASNDLANFLPGYTVVTSAIASWGIPPSVNFSSSAGMKRYNTLNVSVDTSNTSTIMVVVTNGSFIDTYYTNLSLDTHSYAVGNYTIYTYAYYNGVFAEAASQTVEITNIPTSLFCNSTPASLVNLTSSDFTVNCYINNTLDNTSIYESTLKTSVGSVYWFIPWDSTEEIYTAENDYYYSYANSEDFGINFSKTDYERTNTSLGDISFQPILIELPPWIDDVISICLFPTHHDVKPVGQTLHVGIFRVINLDNESRNVSIKLNVTLPTNISQGMENGSDANWTNMIVLSDSYQTTITDLPAFDGTQNVSAYSSYRWLWTNCTNASGFINGSVTHYRDYDWFSYSLGSAIICITDSNWTTGENVGVWNGTIISSFGNTSIWAIDGFNAYNNTNAAFYREENNTASMELNWTVAGIKSIQLNFTLWS